MKTYFLTPTHGQKSFYNKATVLETETTIQLKSYDTIVSTYNKETKELSLLGYFSQTTAKHIRAFCSMFTEKGISKKEMEEKIVVQCQ